jgi:hypothetical protein
MRDAIMLRAHTTHVITVCAVTSFLLAVGISANEVRAEDVCASLGGSYTVYGGGPGLASVDVDNGTMTNEYGWETPYTCSGTYVFAQYWGTGGDIVMEGQRINWENGTWWVKVGACPSTCSGARTAIYWDGTTYSNYSFGSGISEHPWTAYKSIADCEGGPNTGWEYVWDTNSCSWTLSATSDCYGGDVAFVSSAPSSSTCTECIHASYNATCTMLDGGSGYCDGEGGCVLEMPPFGHDDAG